MFGECAQLPVMLLASTPPGLVSKSTNPRASFRVEDTGGETPLHLPDLAHADVGEQPGEAVSSLLVGLTPSAPIAGDVTGYTDSQSETSLNSLL